MTIATAIDRVDTLKPNHQSREMKIAWLSELDGLIHDYFYSKKLSDLLK